MPDKIRVGVIGTSQHAEENHIASIQSHPRAVVAAVCGRSQQRAQAVAERWQIAQVYADYREMIARAGLDAVLVSTPDAAHYPMSMAALDAGLHVFCEKPLALTARQAREMYEAAQAAGVVHMTNFNFRWVPHFRQVRDLIAQGYIGRPFNLSMRWWMGYGRGGQYSWRFDPRHANGMLGDLGAHLIDLARTYLGEIRRVSAQAAAAEPRPPAPDGFYGPSNDTSNLLLEFSGGALGVVQVSNVVYCGDDPFGEIQTVLHGAEGSLEVTYNHADARLVGLRAGEAAPRDLPVDERFYGATDPNLTDTQRFDQLFKTDPAGARLFVDAILGVDQPDATFYDGWQVQRVIDAGLESARTGQWIVVGE